MIINKRKRKYDYHKIADAIESIVSGEDRRSPYCDRMITALIEERGIETSQATVTHLRKLMRISASHKRRHKD